MGGCRSKCRFGGGGGRVRCCRCRRCSLSSSLSGGRQGDTIRSCLQLTTKLHRSRRLLQGFSGRQLGCVLGGLAGWGWAGRQLAGLGGGVIGQISRDLPLSAHWAEAGSVGSSILVPERREFVVVNQILEPTFFFFDPLPLLSSQDPRTLAIPAEEQAPDFLRAPKHLRIIAYFRLPCQDTTSFCIVSV